jgi:peptidoglycan-associated lipoprotein
MKMRQWITSAIVVALVAVTMTGCSRPWFGKKKSSTSPYGGLGTETDTTLGGGTGLDTALPGEEPLADRSELAGTEAVATALSAVLFDYDSAQIVDSERGKVEAVAALLTQNTAMTVVLEGHCDERGSNEYNLTLGERRALAVRAFLMGLGVDTARIQTRSFGEERPKNPGHDEAAWAENRRVEFVTVQ